MGALSLEGIVSGLGRAPSLFGSVPPAGQRLAAAIPDRDAQRAILTPWRRWYKTSRWQALRLRVLARDGCTCQRCGRIESDTSQLVADHVMPHRGDVALFWDVGNLQTLCAPCHNSAKQAEERGGARG